MKDNKNSKYSNAMWCKDNGYRLSDLECFCNGVTWYIAITKSFNSKLTLAKITNSNLLEKIYKHSISYERAVLYWLDLEHDETLVTRNDVEFLKSIFNVIPNIKDDDPCVLKNVRTIEGNVEWFVKIYSTIDDYSFQILLNPKRKLLEHIELRKEYSLQYLIRSLGEYIE